jgi:hypothetical protein
LNILWQNRQNVFSTIEAARFGACAHFIVTNLEDKPKSTDALVDLFLARLPSSMRNTNARKWLAAALPLTAGPTELMKEIEDSLAVPSSPELPRTIIRGIAFCLAESPEQENHFERPDRLPLFRARREATARERESTRDFVGHVFESWVLAQHAYWSVGRGLADARAQGKMLLRLKVVPWTRGLGFGARSIPWIATIAYSGLAADHR